MDPAFEVEGTSPIRVFLAAWLPLMLVQLLAAVILLLVGDARAIHNGLPASEAVALIAFSVTAPFALARPIAAIDLTFPSRSLQHWRPYFREDDDRHPWERVASDPTGRSLFLQVADDQTRANLGDLAHQIRLAGIRSLAYLVAPLPTLVPIIFLWNRFGWEGLIAFLVVALYGIALSFSWAINRRRCSFEYEKGFSALTTRYRFDVLSALRMPLPASAADERHVWSAVMNTLEEKHSGFSDQAELSETVDPIKYEHPVSSLGQESLVRTIDAAVSTSIDDKFSGPRPVSFNGFISAEYRTRDGEPVAGESLPQLRQRAHYQIRIRIAGERLGSLWAPLLTQGRVAPIATFRITPDSDELQVSPDELLMEALTDGTETSREFSVFIPERVGEVHLWLQVRQEKKLVQVVELSALVSET